MSVAQTVVRLVNPIRAAFTALTILGLVLFLPNFIHVRLDERWPWEGWLCRGAWPLVWILLGLIVLGVGSVGIRIWTYEKWQRWRQTRRPIRVGPPAPPPNQPTQVG